MKKTENLLFTLILKCSAKVKWISTNLSETFLIFLYDLKCKAKKSYHLVKKLKCYNMYLFAWQNPNKTIQYAPPHTSAEIL